MAYNIAILYGSVRGGRLGVRVVHWMEAMLKEHGHEVTVVDQQEHQLPMLSVPFHYMKPGEAPANIQKVADALTAADGFVVVGGEYNHAIQPGLSNLIDHYHRAQFGFKPGLIATYSYGPFAGVRAATQLRALLGEVGMVTIPTTVAVPSIMETLSEEGAPQNETMKEYATAAVNELGFYVQALAEARAKGTPG